MATPEVANRSAEAERSRREDERRRYERRPHFENATLITGRWPAERRFAVRTVDLSPVGARVLVVGGAAPDMGTSARLRVYLPGEAPGRGPRELSGLVANRSSAPGGVQSVGLSFTARIDEQSDAESTRVRRRGALVLAGLLALLMCVLRIGQLEQFWYAPWLRAYSLLTCAYIVSRIVISSFYREPEDRGYRPSVSVIIPVKNEADAIASTVSACLASRYPADRLEIIVVDDASTDSTWATLQRLREVHPRLKLIRFPENRGKRQALGAGIAVAEGDVFVFVDSDSIPDPEGVYRLVQPLKDPSVGAVSGHVEVAVDPGSVISMMESVRYHLGHCYIKGAESVFGAVTCCPGPFSAYRREAVLGVLDGWLKQKFLGVPATFGDDRSLTLRVLRSYRVLFHAGARCRTKVPDRWMQFFRQQLRWKKSWMREFPTGFRLMWREHPVVAAGWFAGAAITFCSPLVLAYALFYLPLAAGVMPGYYLLAFLLTYVCLSLVCFHQTGTPYWYYGPVAGAVYLCVLVWQNYYALLTINKTAWGTR
ncbi:MAG: glycosyltransferase family 2 protein [Elusimicrobia bacterium]|nr:glycosyltransferase family 2 protein [Elusimicrobiota bacterium]